MIGATVAVVVGQMRTTFSRLPGAPLRAFLESLGRAAPRAPEREPKRNRSLTRRLLLLAVVASSPAFVILSSSEMDLRLSREAEIRDVALRTAHQAQADVERVFEGVDTLLRAVGEVPAVRDFQTDACAAYLRSLLARVPQLKSLSVLDITGRVQCQDWQPRDEARYHTLPYFRSVLATRRFAVGSHTVVPGGSGDGSVLPLAAPLLRANGTFNGVLVASLDLGWLRQRLAERGLAHGNALTIADREGVVLFTEPPDRPAIGTPIDDVQRTFVRSDEAGAFDLTDEDGSRSVVGFVPATLTGGVHIFAEVSRGAAFAVLDRTARRGTMVGLIGLLVALGVTWLLGSFLIERPIRRLLGTVGAWRRGNQTARTKMRPDGGEIEAVGAAFDQLLDEVTAHQAETARASRARLESERRYRSLIELSPDPQFVDIDSRIVYANAAMVRLLGAATANQVLGRSSLDFVAADYKKAVRGRLAALRRTGQPNPPMEQRWQRLDGVPLDLEVVSAPVPWDGEQGNQVILRDISTRKQAAERQEILVHELNHRVKNTLATVQSMAMQTLRTAPSLSAFGRAFVARLISLSATQTLLTQKAWEHAPLRDLLANEFRPFGDERHALDGADVLLPPRMALPLGMVFHELVTNATKYGALVAPAGRVLVSWSVEGGAGTGERRLKLAWREENGPPVEPPSRRGFGSTLIDRTVTGELGGTYERVFGPTGLICLIDVPLAA